MVNTPTKANGPGSAFARALVSSPQNLLSGTEIMAAWIHEELDQGGGVGLLNSGNDCWHKYIERNRSGIHVHELAGAGKTGCLPSAPSRTQKLRAGARSRG